MIFKLFLSVLAFAFLVSLYGLYMVYKLSSEDDGEEWPLGRD